MIKLSEESVFYLPKELDFFFRVPFFHSVVNFKVHKLQNGTGFCFCTRLVLLPALCCAVSHQYEAFKVRAPREGQGIL